MGRLPNGYGSVKKLSGKRRKPYQALVTTGWDMVDGKAKQKQKSLGTFVTRADAMMALAEYNNDPTAFDANTFTFTDLYNAYKKTLIARSESTQKQKESFFATCDTIHNRLVTDITSEELQQIVSGKKSRNTQQMFISFFRDMWRFGMAEGILKKNPAEYLLKTGERKEVEINPFTYSEYLLMPEEYDLFFYTGLRADEMLNLRKENIIENGTVIAVPGTKTDNAFRYVPVSDKIAPIVEEKVNKVWTLHNNYTSLNKAVKSLSGHTTHDMRKSFATALDRSGVPEIVIKKLLGHAITDVTHGHYIKRDFSELKEAVNAMDIRLLG